MKKQICIIILLLTCRICEGQIPDWEWARSAGNNADDGSTSIAVDVNGNSYITGSFRSSSISFGNIILTNSGGGADIFIAKYNSGGNVIWAKSIGIANDNFSTGVTIDAFENIFITGYYFGSSIIFGSDTLINTGSIGSNDIFIAKYDSSGNNLWAKNAGGTYDEYCYGITTDAIGNAYITGFFYSDTITFGNTSLVYGGVGYSDLFTVKYDSSGNVLWAKSASGDQEIQGYSLTVDMNENVCVTGAFSSHTLSFGNIILTNADSIYYKPDVFVVKYDSTGTVIWAKSAGGNMGDAWDEGRSIKSDANGNIYVAGYFGSSAITFGTTTLSNAGNGNARDIFIVKYSSNGNVVWAKRAGGHGDDAAFGITVDTNSNVYLTGIFSSLHITFGNTTLTSLGHWDVFAAKYNSTGNVLWAKSAGGTDWDGSYKIGVDGSGSVYITGDFGAAPCTFGNIILTSAGSSDIFIAKLSITTGIEEQNNQFGSVTIFPNPFEEKLTVNNYNNELSEIILYDVVSRKLLQREFINSVTLNTEQLAKGLYLYEVRSRNSLCKKGKVVKE